MSKNICVYCSASNEIDRVYFQAANELATLMAQRSHTLVYGGGCLGLMGEIARTMHHNRGKVIGIIPEGLRLKEVCYEQADELIVTKDMRERKGLMDLRSDAFITLPGGFGTLEEITEMITSRQLGFHRKPLVIINTNRFYDPMIALFEQIYEQKFAKTELKDAYYVTSNIVDALKFIEEYTPVDIASKI